MEELLRDLLEAEQMELRRKQRRLNKRIAQKIETKEIERLRRIQKHTNALWN